MQRSDEPKIIWLNYQNAADLVTARIGPRPTTDYKRPVACPWCGAVRARGQKDQMCMACLDVGHTERFMGQAEMRWRAEVWRAQGYEKMAERLCEIADTI